MIVNVMIQRKFTMMNEIYLSVNEDKQSFPGELDNTIANITEKISLEVPLR